MCGRFVAASDPDGLVRFFVVDDRRDADDPPSYNVAPTDAVRAVVEHDARRHLVTLRWGLVPRWAKSTRDAARLINARSETVAEKPAFREALRRRRCLIPADGFYEWERLPDGSREPYLIRPEVEPLFAFAGLWETWRNPQAPDAQPLRTCTILTRAADERLIRLHDRMPVVLGRAAWDAWLDRGTTDPDAVRDVLAATAPPAITLYRVSRAVNSVRNNSPELLSPV